MKKETQEKMDKIAPLLAHLLDGGTIIRTTGLFSGAKYNLQDSDRIVNELIHSPSGWAIHREPRVIYLNEYADGIDMHTHYSNPEEPAQYCPIAKVVRFIEDLNWKPDQDADHHLPEPSDKAKAYQATV